jgi:hypothetical protein
MSCHPYKYIWTVMDLWWMTQQVHEPRNAFWELMDLSDTSWQVDGPPVYFTLLFFKVYWASTLVHVSSPKGHLMQCHIGFLMMWRREQGERKMSLPRETTTSWTKQLMRQLHNYCMSFCCHETHNIPFYVHTLRNYIDLPDDLPDNSLYMLYVESIQDYL